MTSGDGSALVARRIGDSHGQQKCFFKWLNSKNERSKRSELCLRQNRERLVSKEGSQQVRPENGESVTSAQVLSLDEMAFVKTFHLSSKRLLSVLSQEASSHPRGFLDER